MEKYRSSSSSSSTARDSEVDISQEEKESLLNTAMRQRREPSKKSRAVFIALLVAILAVSNVILGVILLGQQQSSHKPPGDAHEYPHNHPHEHKKPIPVPLGGLPHVNAHPDWLPPEEWRTEVFRLHQIYGEEPIGTAKEAWLSMIPKGKGFIVVKNDTQLPHMPGLRRPAHEQKACVAIFHQMHCLYITYKAYWNARGGQFDEIPPEHLIHCWDYLRQSIMCAGDTSLEWVNKEETFQTSGWGFQHTCKNFDAIFEWTESNRFTEKVEID
ncbi:hypothetical protein IF1G_04236 [Cordyceps javanica]|uniref:Tat pathway signal sequence n=1 Tax=Cordyceps javanica TaxID=43265 RepID=A0A545W2P1_9HYPO|nr:hypothetical protein IF1G_04236 [Cordyceps javanica]TQW08251.1 hypothetical protein IF2G_04127 [Cordyceps javanica]